MWMHAVICVLATPWAASASTPFAPELFDMLLPMAGYGIGTLEPSNKGFGAPRVQSGIISEIFLDVNVLNLAKRSWSSVTRFTTWVIPAKGR